jgi:HK97 family phage prohead protease
VRNIRTKKDTKATHKTLGSFSCFKAKGDDEPTVIEGFANKAVVDRGGEVIPPDAWDLENFKKNPIIFFNHDRNMPIGKAVSFKVTDDVLFLRAKISRSKDPKIAMIRDLVKEGILSTFSVGFDDHGSAFQKDDGTFHHLRRYCTHEENGV